MTPSFHCRSCGSTSGRPVLDLGLQPLANNLPRPEDLSRPEPRFPLRVAVCDSCWMLQITDIVPPVELFSEYLYFSSFSDALLRHSKQAVEQHLAQEKLHAGSFVVEVASNDGYLLRNFVASGIPCLGIEPTASTAAAAQALGIPVLREFFGEALGQRLAAQGQQADLIAGNNVYAHVPDINDFTRGLAALLKPEGVVTLEFPHLMRLIEHTQFDTVYHEHFSYLSLGAVSRIFAAAGLRVWDVEEQPTHGGSLRIYGCLAAAQHRTTGRVSQLLAQEQNAGLMQLATYAEFQARADKVKNDLLSWLLEQKRAGRRVAAYGAAAKGNTLLNYAGVKPDLLSYVCDAAPAKQGKYLPGSHVPVLAPASLRQDQPDFVLILPWNIAREVEEQMSFLREAGTKFVTAIPQLRIW
jgi:SAM-dependent methyltransferase